MKDMAVSKTESLPLAGGRTAYALGEATCFSGTCAALAVALSLTVTYAAS
jgi:hypothetical protein